MKKFLLIFLIFGIFIISSGCVQTNPDQGLTPDHTKNLSNQTSTSAVAGSTMNSLTNIRTSAMETIISDNNNNSGVSSFITPSEPNKIKENISPNLQPKLFLFSMEEAPQLPGHALFIPTHIPQGFSYLDGTLSSDGVISLRISNATTTVVYIQAPQWSDVGGYLVGKNVRYKNIYANGSTYGCSEADSLHQLTWTDGSHDYCLIGELNCSELVSMAGSTKILDYEILDRLPYKISNPEILTQDPERIRIIFPQSWILTHYPDRYHSRKIAITMSSDEFNASFSPDPRDNSMLRHKEVMESEPVVYLSLPKKMFNYFNVEPGTITINYPTDFFRYYTNMESLYEDHWKDPYPPGWKPRNPETMVITPEPTTPANPK